MKNTLIFGLGVICGLVAFRIYAEYVKDYQDKNSAPKEGVKV